MTVRYDLPPSALATLEEISDEASVRARALETDFVATDIVESALRIARILLMRWPGSSMARVDFPNRTNTLYEQWIDRCRAEGNPSAAAKLVSWILGVRGPYINYPIFLYNRSFGKSKEILGKFLTSEARPPGYLELVFLNLLRQGIGLSHTDVHHLTSGYFHSIAPYYHRLFTEDIVDRWLATKKRKLRYYSGETNTVLGLYDEFFSSPHTGIVDFNRDAELGFDLGGGFSTSEIERLLGRRFISADLIRPDLRAYDDDLILKMRRPDATEVVVDDATRAAFIARQSVVEHLPFDVFSNSFPTDADSYAVVSTGFMTSTFRTRAKRLATEVRNAGFGHFATSVLAIIRVLELVALGKSVDLFTIQRASARSYKYKTCFLQWRSGRLVNVVTTDDRAHDRLWRQRGVDKIYEAINPENPYFLRMLSM